MGNTNVQVVKDRWVKGWEAILEFTGVGRSTTVKKYQREYHFPLRCLPTGEPVVIVSEANEWLRAFTELTSPFRKRKLTGAALRASLGEKMGAMAVAEKESVDK